MVYYFRGRYLDTGLSRFVSRDPAGFQGGGHLYNYVGNAPTMGIDPTGLWGDEYAGAYGDEVAVAGMVGSEIDFSIGFLEGFSGAFIPSAAPDNVPFGIAGEVLSDALLVEILYSAMLGPLPVLNALGLTAVTLIAIQKGWNTGLRNFSNDESGWAAFIMDMFPPNPADMSENWKSLVRKLKKMSPAPAAPSISTPPGSVNISAPYPGADAPGM